MNDEKLRNECPIEEFDWIINQYYDKEKNTEYTLLHKEWKILKKIIKQWKHKNSLFTEKEFLQRMKNK